MKRVALILVALNVAIMAWVGTLSAQETPPALAGMLGVRYYDHQQNPALSTRQFTLNTFDGRVLPVEIPDEVLNASGGIFAIQNEPIEILTDNTAPRDGIIRASAIRLAMAPRWYTADPVGSVNWKVLLCRANGASAEPVSKSRVETVFGGATNGLTHYWSTTSRGQTTVNPNVQNWKTMARSFSQYQSMSFNSRLDATFADCTAAHGVSTSGAYNITVIFNVDMFNGYALGGYSYSGGSLQRQTWISVLEPSYFHSSLLAHEIGHSYGMPHSNNSDGDSNPYDNPWDLMSDSYAGDYDGTYGYYPPTSNSYYYQQLGLISAGNAYTLPSGTRATITLDRWGLASSSNYFIATIPIPGSSTFFTLETRKKSRGGYEGNLIGDGVLVYAVNNGRSEPAWLALNGDSYNAANALTTGESYTNSQYDFTVQIVSETAEGYVVHISQGAALAEIEAIAPSGTVTSTDVNFTWQPADGGITAYIITLKSADGAQTLKINAGLPCASTCTFAFNPAAHGWKWREGQTYKWSVLAKTGGAKVAKSAAMIFVFDGLPDSIALISPANGSTNPDRTVTFTWANDARFDEYRVVIKKANGSIVSGAWVARSAVCGAQCNFTYTFGAKKKTYTWKVLGRNSEITGKAKSLNQTVRVNTP